MKLAAVVLVLVVAAAGAWLGYEGLSGRGPLAEPLGGRCTLGVAGTQATLTITGPGARGACEESIGFDPAVYIEEIPPSGAVICSHTIDGTTRTVRDVGMHLVGSDICASMAAPTE